MLRLLARSTLVAAALTVGMSLLDATTSTVAAQNPRHPIYCRDHDHGHPDLFYNYYIAPNCGGVGADIYVAPLPVPPEVGHTYYTYQPFMPHEWLYKHKRVYHRYYNEGRGLTRTSIRWW